MKKLMLIIVAGIYLSGFAYATEGPTFVKSSDKTFAVYFDDWNQTDLTVTIRNAQGLSVLTDKVSQKDATAKKYNLKYLAEGDYKVEIANDQKTLVQDIELSDNSVIVSDESTTYFNPTIVQTDGRIDINVFSLKKDVHMEISDIRMNRLYHEDLDAPMSVNKRFDTSELEAGTYIINVKQNGRSFSQSFTIE